MSVGGRTNKQTQRKPTQPKRNSSRLTAATVFQSTVIRNKQQPSQLTASALWPFTALK